MGQSIQGQTHSQWPKRRSTKALLVSATVVGSLWVIVDLWGFGAQLLLAPYVPVLLVVPPIAVVRSLVRGRSGYPSTALHVLWILLVLGSAIDLAAREFRGQPHPLEPVWSDGSVVANWWTASVLLGVLLVPAVGYMTVLHFRDRRARAPAKREPVN